MRDPGRVVIVGAGATGHTAAKTLRSEGFTGPITLIGNEQTLAYRRPAVSKELLAGTKTIDQVLLGAPAPDIDFRPGVTATRITPTNINATSKTAANRTATGVTAGGTVLLDTGDRIGYDTLLLATGSRAGTLDHLPAEHVFTLRGADDVLPLHEDMQRTGSLLVIGGGLIGCEAAATARSLGVEATVVEAADRPLARVAAPQVSQMYRKMHAEHGVDLHTDVVIDTVETLADGRLRAFARDGRTFTAGTILVSVGSVANIELAAASGIRTRGGILVDTHLETSIPGVFAAGDVAEVPNWILGGTFRSEQWNGAIDQAMAAARSILGNPVAALEVPWGWSNQYGVSLQFAGWTSADDDYIVRGSMADRKFTAFAMRENQLVGAVGIGRPKDMREVRALIAERTAIDRGALGKDSVDLAATAVH